MNMASPAILEPVAVLAPPTEEALYEVVNGQRVELPPTSAYATWISSRLGHRLGPFAETHALGTVVLEMLFILDAERDLRRRPDLAFVSSQRWPLGREIPETGDWEVVPDLAVEVVSPNDLFQDVLAKMREYFQAGVSQVWIVLPAERQVYVYKSPTAVRILASSDELEGGTLLPGFRLSVATLFKSELPAQTPAS
jgi:Uma2 family endonuclease